MTTELQDLENGLIELNTTARALSALATATETSEDGEGLSQILWMLRIHLDHIHDDLQEKLHAALLAENGRPQPKVVS